MTTKSAALFNFFSGFGINTYANTAVPDEAEMPYVTYENIQDNWGNPVSLTVNLWYRTTSEKILNDKVDEIARKLPHYEPFEGGAILFTRGTPFAQALTDDSDVNVKRRYLNINAEFLTLN